MLRFAFPILLACSAAPALADPPIDANMDYDGFLALIQEVRPYRQARLLDWRAFAAAARERNVLILDARSERQFAAGHIAGAVNLPLTEFSVAALAEVIGPDPNRPILIYCNNNFVNQQKAFTSKVAVASLNLYTFNALHSYGYKNVYELGPLLDIEKTGLQFEGLLAPKVAPGA